ncbi:uncharacterized protein PFL1_04391 [Pseudozyma flocculosa PF-1]|uniref:Uncharacterized protein n=2 Tax=Pseudozyma flocculosa TaxID=84751 RepID=A0A5C3FDG4_9BASI|nr:uncharacterized protein PFL1_04391 [Pseudozyma flocculosa PF-1]EPQ28064.1 hypothetical protein PFL1_04391 [Pseudozyma flocculosa PF-1]SPO42186.1 uncharacterized protein PSFLO_07669 [Pseudozyma flocculosa]
MLSPFSKLGLFVGLALSSLLPLALGAENYIVSGDRWKDSDGNFINAHAAGILREGNQFYWVGEYKEKSNGFRGFSLYTSTDLINWQNKGLVVQATSGLPFQVGERPKIIKNASTGKYVLWFHADSSNYSKAQVGVCTASAVAGPYDCSSVFSPLGLESRDMNVYVDDDKTGYLIFATNDNQETAVATMTPDYTGLVKRVATIPGRLEGFGVFKRGGQYNMILSGQSGWRPNPNYRYTASSMSGPWTKANAIAPEDLNTYNSQNTFELSIGSTEVYIGDRWWETDLSQSRYVWQPFKDNVLDYRPLWRINLQDGSYTSPASTTYSLSAGKVSGSNAKTVFAACSACPSGKIGTYIGAGGSVTLSGVQTPDGSAGAVWVSVYYVNSDSYPNWRSGTIQVGSSAPVAVTFPTGGSLSGHLQDTPVKVNLAAGKNTVTLAGPSGGGYAADISHIVVWQSNK